MSAEDADALILVARAIRTRGLKGEVVAELLTDFPDRFEQISEMVAVAPSGEQRQLKLESHWFQGDRVILKFGGYDDVDAATSLVGYEFGLPEAERVQLGAGEFYEWELGGCLVENTHGAIIGRVTDVMKTGGVELLVVENETSDEFLIPLAQGIVVDINIEAKRIVVDPPEGLLHL